MTPDVIAQGILLALGTLGTRLLIVCAISFVLYMAHKMWGDYKNFVPLPPHIKTKTHALLPEHRQGDIPLGWGLGITVGLFLLLLLTVHFAAS